MRKGLGIVGMSVLGAMLAVGCGGAMQQDTEEAQPSSSVQSGEQPASIPPEESAQEPDESESGRVGAEASCCHVQCADGNWYGPFKSVKYNNCATYGRYYCPAYSHGGYVSNQWRACTL